MGNNFYHMFARKVALFYSSEHIMLTGNRKSFGTKIKIDMTIKSQQHETEASEGNKEISTEYRKKVEQFLVLIFFFNLYI